MTEVMTPTENSPVVVQLLPVIDLTDDQFFEFCQINRDLRIERMASGELSLCHRLDQAQETATPSSASN